jgi:hypothetical protein
VGAVTRRARPFSVYGRLVGTDAEIAADLSIPLEVVLRAIHEARLQEWGRNGRQEPVWQVKAVRRALGWPEPERPRRGAPQFQFTIPGSRGRRGRQEPAGLFGGESGPDGRQEAASGREWAAAIDEEGERC